MTAFDNLAFPVAKVRYTGSGYSATLYRERDRIYRARVSYSHAIGPGPRNAIRAALKAFEKARADIDGPHEEFIAVPGSLNDDFYVFTFVPARFFDAR